MEQKFCIFSNNIRTQMDEFDSRVTWKKNPISDAKKFKN